MCSHIISLAMRMGYEPPAHSAPTSCYGTFQDRMIKVQIIENMSRKKVQEKQSSLKCQARSSLNRKQASWDRFHVLHGTFWC